MKYVKCYIPDAKFMHWIHHQLHPDIRYSFHKSGGRMKYVTLTIPDVLVDSYLQQLRTLYGVGSLTSFLISIK